MQIGIHPPLPHPMRGGGGGVGGMDIAIGVINAMTHFECYGIVNMLVGVTMFCQEHSELDPYAIIPTCGEGHLNFARFPGPGTISSDSLYGKSWELILLKD